jgi:hypothetical protein
VRDALGLRSNWFQFGWLSLTSPSAPVAPGGGITLNGVARGLSGVTLEAKTSGRPWLEVSPVTPDGTGAFTVQVNPEQTTQYRLASGNARGALIKVTVVS